MRTFHRLACQFCRQWIETTRNEYNGLYPSYTLGSLSARNFVHLDDCDQPTPPNSLPNAQGGDTAPRPPGCGRRLGFPVNPATGDPCQPGLPPRSEIVLTRSRLTRSQVRIGGNARSRDCSVVRKVMVSVARRTPSGCRHLNPHRRFGTVRSCARPVWLSARGTARWSFRRRLHVPRGRYLVRSRARDATGIVERPRRARQLHRRR